MRFPSFSDSTFVPPGFNASVPIPTHTSMGCVRQLLVNSVAFRNRRTCDGSYDGEPHSTFLCVHAHNWYTLRMQFQWPTISILWWKIKNTQYSPYLGAWPREVKATRRVSQNQILHTIYLTWDDMSEIGIKLLNKISQIVWLKVCGEYTNIRSWSGNERGNWTTF